MSDVSATPVAACVLGATPDQVIGGESSGAWLAERVQLAADALLIKQRQDRGGAHWCAELEGDSILSSEYILMKFILGQQDDQLPDGTREMVRLRRIANQIRLSQRADGTWGQYPGSPADVSSCVKAYLCLKLMGDGVDSHHMVAARAQILELGGAEACNTFSTFYFACLGIVSWEACPVIPPQIVHLPGWFPFHLRKVAAWTRTMILPLALCSALRPLRPLPGGVNIDELFIDATYKNKLSKKWSPALLTWNNFFLAIDRGLKLCRRAGWMPCEDSAIAASEKWLLERMDPKTTEGLGAIFPPMVYIQVALQKMGYTRDHPVIRQAEADLDAFMIDSPSDDPSLDHIRLQPCFSPVWDTAIALDALAEAGFRASSDPRIAASCDWLRAREVLRKGDWIDNLRPEDRTLTPGVDIACWAFEYRNDWYPDVDDTCMVAKALFRCCDRAGETTNRDAARRAIRFIMAMQNDDGGWAAFDRTTDRPWMEAVPFADHNAMQDPSCSDITGRVLESIVICGVTPDHPAINAAVRYLVATQQPEGCWWGRWGVNYIYGTWQAVNGLAAAGYTVQQPALRRAADWFLSVQNTDGGFGETANSYLDRSLMGKGPSTASQTAWGLMTLMNLLGASHPSCRAAAQWLTAHQLTEGKRPFTADCVNDATGVQMMHGPLERVDHISEPGAGLCGARALGVTVDAVVAPLERMIAGQCVTGYDTAIGGWNEHWFTGTGFPKVFYLRYHLYRHSFPLKALAKYARLIG